MNSQKTQFLLVVVITTLVILVIIFATALVRTQQEVDSLAYKLLIRTIEMDGMIQRLLQIVKRSQSPILSDKACGPEPPASCAAGKKLTCTDGQWMCADIFDISTWKTYRNEKYGFEVRYPFNARPEEGPMSDLYLSNFAFKDDSGTYTFGVEIRDTSLQKEVDYQKFLIVGHIADEIKNETKIKKGDYSWVKLDYEYYESLEPIIIKNRSVAIINNERYSYSIHTESDVVDQILSTFKFIPSTSLDSAAARDVYPKLLYTPSSIIAKGNQYIIGKVGKDYFEKNFILNIKGTEYDNKRTQAEYKNTPYFKYWLHYENKALTDFIKENENIENEISQTYLAIIDLVLDETGNIIGGDKIPDCVTRSALCMFAVNRDRAFEIATQKGMQAKDYGLRSERATGWLRWNLRDPTPTTECSLGRWLTIDVATGIVEGPGCLIPPIP